MSMRKKLFARYFTVCAMVIVISFAFLGVAFLILSWNYFRSEKIEVLSANAHKISAVTREYEGDSDFLNNIFNVFGNAIDADIFLVSPDGNVVVASEKTPENERAALIESKYFDSDGSKRPQGQITSLSGLYDQPQILAVARVELKDNKLSYVFVATPAQAIQTFARDMIQIFVFSSIIVLVVVSIILYAATSRMVKPLREISEAVERFGKGDFSVRINTAGQDELEQLAVSFNSMASSLSALESSRRNFIANISHELKTPMTSIAGFVDGMIDGTIAPDQQKKYMKIVSSEIKRLSRLVHSMLNLSRIESGELSLKSGTFDICWTVLQVTFSFEKQIEEKKIDIRGLTDEKIWVEADSDLIYQVVYNLVENAVKFTDEGGWISFSFETKGSQIYVGIKNSGKGISKEDMPKVFDRFYKTDYSRSLDKSGVGIGLYIVRSIISLHKQEIAIRSAEGEFTEFLFSLPKAKNVKAEEEKTN